MLNKRKKTKAKDLVKFKKLTLQAERRRRKIRDSKLIDEDDPFFLMRKLQYKWDPGLVDKLEVKEILRGVVKTPKTLFEVFKDGETNFEPPKTGKLILKSTLGGSSEFVKIVNASWITKKRLRKLYKKWIKKSYEMNLADGLDFTKNIKNRMFGEEFLGENITDWKIFYYGEDNIRYSMVLDRFKKKKKENLTFITYDKNFIEIPRDENGETFDRKITNSDIITFTRLLEVVKRIYSIIKYGARFDFYVVNGEIYLGEITLDFSNGNLYRKNNLTEKETSGQEEVARWFKEDLQK